jgi:hypothetical protein
MQSRHLLHEHEPMSSDIAIHRLPDEWNEPNSSMETHMGVVPDASLGMGSLDSKFAQEEPLIEDGAQGLSSRDDEPSNESLSAADEVASNDLGGEDFVDEEF